MPLHNDLREFIELLNSNEVDYLIVGAFAVAYYGYPRYTGDLDILVRPSIENASRVCRALHQFGFQSLGITPADLAGDAKVVQIGLPPNRIDLITSLSGVPFEEAWASGERAQLEGLVTRFIGRSALLKNKDATGRSKDVADAAELRKRESRRQT